MASPRDRGGPTPDPLSGTFVVVPAFNEEEVVRSTVEGLLRLGVHVVLVDDCSTDETVERIYDLPISVLHHAANMGQGSALRTGIAYALRRGAEIVVTFDADGQHDPDDVPRLVDTLLDKDLDVVVGSRFLGEASNMGRLRKGMLLTAVLITRLTSGLPITDVHNGLRVFRASSVARLRITSHRMAHASDILSEIARKKLRFAEAPTTVRYTPYSKKKGQSALDALDVVYELLLGRMFL